MGSYRRETIQDLFTVLMYFNIVFDPSGKSTDNDVTSESSQGIPSIGILQDHIVVDTIINTSKFSYEGLNGFNKEMWNSLFKSSSRNCG